MTDKHGRPIGTGDMVHYFIPGHGSPAGTGYVIGECYYSDNWSHVMLADEQSIGMGIHSGHCTVVGHGHLDKVLPWRTRYLAVFPDGLKPETFTAQ